MATLFERLTGINLPSDSTNTSEQKMAIHSFTGALNELRRGKFTGQQIATMYSLTAQQQTVNITCIGTNTFVGVPSPCPISEELPCGEDADMGEFMRICG